MARGYAPRIRPAMKFVWPESARSELRAIDRETAVRILDALTRYADSGEGDLKALSGQWQGCTRLRIGYYRSCFVRSRNESSSCVFGTGPMFIAEPFGSTDRTRGF